MAEVSVNSFVRYCQQTTGASYAAAVTAAAVAWASSRIDPNGSPVGELGPFGVSPYLASARGIDLVNAEDYPSYFHVAAVVSNGWRNWAPFPTAWNPGPRDPNAALRGIQANSPAAAALPTVRSILAGHTDPRAVAQSQHDVAHAWGRLQGFVGPYARRTHGTLTDLSNQFGRIIR